jgi:hypothetical protein
LGKKQSCNSQSCLNLPSFFYVGCDILKELSGSQVVVEIDVESAVLLALYQLLQLAHSHRFPAQGQALLVLLVGGVKFNLLERFFGLLLKVLAVV